MLAFISLAVLLVAHPSLGAFDPNTYNNSKTINSDIDFHWSLDLVADPQVILFAVEVKTSSGWIGFGIAEQTSGSMPGADIAVSRIVDGALVVEDRYAVDKAEPILDDPCINNWIGRGFTRENGVTVVELARPLKADDWVHDRPIVDTGFPIKFIFAFGTSNTFGYHGDTQRTMATIDIFDATRDPLAVVIADPSTITNEMKESSFTIPTDTTTYSSNVCRTTSWNEWLIAVEMAIQPENIAFVHHIVLYGFVGSPSCDGFQVSLWASASHDVPFVMPDDVGLYLGDYDSFSMQIHYNNPGHVSGVVDSSGIKVYTTATARTHRAAMLQLGDPSVSLADGDKATLRSGLSSYTFKCPSSCTSKWSSDLTVFGSLLHTHKTGVKMETEQLRDGEKIRTLNKVEYYDFSLQELATLQPVVLKKGDELVTTCYYDTDGTTTFGIGSENEMCMDFVYYYPAQVISEGFYCGYDLCGSLVEDKALAGISDLNRDFGSEANACGDETSSGSIVQSSAVLVALTLALSYMVVH